MSPTEYRTTEYGKNLLVWGIEDIEQETLLQASKTARLPFVPGHVALMPDAHVGLGSTVGSVIPTKGAIIPSAIGVDIGCLDKDTEFLSPSGWVKFSSWNGEKVAQYHPQTGVADFVSPLEYIVREDEELLHFRTKYGINMVVSEDHRVLAWKITGRDRRREQVVLSGGELAEIHNSLVQGAKYEIETSFSISREDRCELDGDQLRVQVMFMADGWLDGNVGQLRFKKKRKIERARKLLSNAGIEYSERVVGGDVTQIRFKPPIPVKDYQSFWDCGPESLSVIAEEVLNWDGNEDDEVFFTSLKSDADFMNYCFAAVGYRSVMRCDIRNGAEEWRVFRYQQTKVGFAGSPKTEVGKYKTIDGKSYCFTVPTGFLVVRREGNVFITGNCGMAAIKLNIREEELPDLTGFMSDIERAIPAGVGKGRERNDSINVLEKMGGFWTGSPQTSKLVNKAISQCGTLGSGNHFFEICIDETGIVWIVLHSGSRGIGNELAKLHIEGAKNLMKKYFIDLEDRDLAYFVEGTREFNSYISDMLWAQKYALLNRKTMLSNAYEAFSFFMLQRGFDSLKIEQEINCHHNFTTRENYNGSNLWITRKGAIKAGLGDWGIIPGSMGTDTYIVQGLGNHASYNSCSHGAGRVYSRKKAKELFDANDLSLRMDGRVWNIDRASSLVDEIPDAYKDIRKVMEAQSDLVGIRHTLMQVFNYKG